MFSGCSSLQSLYLSNFNTSQLYKMEYMFNNCSSLEYINLFNYYRKDIFESLHITGNLKICLNNYSQFIDEKNTLKEKNVKNECQCSNIYLLSKEFCEKAPTSDKDFLCIYDEENKKCIEKLKCLKVQNPINEEDCSSFPTSDLVTKKCILIKEGQVKSCKEEDKQCNEITYGATEDICRNSAVSSYNKKCVFHSYKKGCVEIQKITYILILIIFFIILIMIILVILLF